MSVVFGHPTGNPNSHHAALSYHEAGRLAALCIPWIPTPRELAILRAVPCLRAQAGRLERRYFQPLADAPKVQGRLGEWSRMIQRLALPETMLGERLAYEANDWLMRTLRSQCRASSVTAVHSYEDCSLWAFEEAKRLGKACIYDMPIGFYADWSSRLEQLAREYEDWVPASGLPSTKYVRPRQKRAEMDLADIVLAPCTFAKDSILRHVDKQVHVAPYGVDLEFWSPTPRKPGGPLRFIYAGQISLRKGIPVLFEAWRSAALEDATLELVGLWQLSERILANLPLGVSWTSPLSRAGLREKFRGADVLVFPSFFEGFGLVILEALACGVTVIASDATAGPDILTPDSGAIFAAGSVEELAERLRLTAPSRRQDPNVAAACRQVAERYTWKQYRSAVAAATAGI